MAVGVGGRRGRRRRAARGEHGIRIDWRLEAVGVGLVGEMLGGFEEAPLLETGDVDHGWRTSYGFARGWGEEARCLGISTHQKWTLPHLDSRPSTGHALKWKNGESAYGTSVRTSRKTTQSYQVT